MLSLLLLGQVPTSRQLIDAFAAKMAAAKTVTVTATVDTEEFPRPQVTKWWWMKGGFYRYEGPTGTLIASPQRCWAYKPTGKEYKVYPGAEPWWSIVAGTGLGEFGGPGQLPPIGAPKRVTWRGMSVWRVEVDGRKLTKETVMYFFFDVKTLNHVGTSANLGSITQVRVFRDIKLDPKIDPKMFSFTPPKGWKLAKG